MDIGRYPSRSRIRRRRPSVPAAANYVSLIKSHLASAMPPRLQLSPPAALYCYKPSTLQRKQCGKFAATTLGPAKMCISALRKACPHLSPECLPSPVDPRFGSPSTIIDPNLSAYTPDKPWAPSRSSLSPTRHRHRLSPARTASRLSRNTSRPPQQQQLKALALSRDSTSPHLSLPPRGQRNQREEPPHAEQHAPRPFAGRTLYQGLGR